MKDRRINVSWPTHKFSFWKTSTRLRGAGGFFNELLHITKYAGQNVEIKIDI